MVPFPFFWMGVSGGVVFYATRYRYLRLFCLCHWGYEILKLLCCYRTSHLRRRGTVFNCLRHKSGRDVPHGTSVQKSEAFHLSFIICSMVNGQCSRCFFFDSRLFVLAQTPISIVSVPCYLPQNQGKIAAKFIDKHFVSLRWLSYDRLSFRLKYPYLFRDLNCRELKILDRTYFGDLVLLFRSHLAL